MFTSWMLASFFLNGCVINRECSTYVVLNDDQKKLNLALNMKRYNVDIGCLQETKNSGGAILTTANAG